METYLPSPSRTIFPLFFELIVIHLLALLGIILYPPTWKLFFLMIGMHFVQGLGITLGYHRCLTHRAFDFKWKWAERFFATLGTLALQRGPIWWCSIHRIHHRYSDTSQDPHNSRQGFWYSHLLWMAHLDPRWKLLPKVERYKDLVKDISSDPYYIWLDRYFFVPYLVLLIILYFSGGWPWVFWGGFIASVFHMHFTWAVNSITHRFGYQSFDTKDNSTNNWLIALFASGEGWHNNHHAFPSSPKHGFFKWWEYDQTYLVVLLLKKLRLIHNLKHASQEQIRSGRRGLASVAELH